MKIGLHILQYSTIFLVMIFLLFGFTVNFSVQWFLWSSGLDLLTQHGQENQKHPKTGSFVVQYWNFPAIWIPSTMVQICANNSTRYRYSKITQKFRASTWLRYQRLYICIKNKPRDGPPIRRILLWSSSWFNWSLFCPFFWATIGILTHFVQLFHV